MLSNKKPKKRWLFYHKLGSGFWIIFKPLRHKNKGLIETMLLCTVCSIWGHIELGKVEIREWLEAILRILELIYGKGEFGGKHTIFFQEEGRLKSRLYMKFKC